MHWRLLLSGAACAAGFTWAVGCATGTTSDEPSGGDGMSPAPAMECKMASDCPSGICRAMTTGAKPTCVTPCKQQADCGSGLFCEPGAAGSADGTCVPRSAVHCLSCAKDSDCGAASAACFQAPGDTALACHVDCSLAGSNACPDDYACTDQMVNGKARKLCRPKANLHCIDAQGGFCDGQPMAQPCSRTTTVDGTCTGQRACLPESKRFDKCSAAVPVCKADCAAKDPASCTLNFCAGAAKGPANCGECGKVCPGYMKPNDNVTCASNLMCSFSCKGESYDVDFNPANGCEVTDPTLENHEQSTALDIAPGGQSCFDDEPFSLVGEHLLSDKRVHETPDISGFESDTGSASDWFSMRMTGGFCEANVKVTLQVNGSAHPDCYHLRVVFNSGYTNNCQTSATNGTCTIKDFNTGLYSTGDIAYLEVSKTCPTDQTEDVTYDLTGFF
jgi:hypothetical protein